MKIKTTFESIINIKYYILQLTHTFFLKIYQKRYKYSYFAMKELKKGTIYHACIVR